MGPFCGFVIRFFCYFLAFGLFAGQMGVQPMTPHLPEFPKAGRKVRTSKNGFENDFSIFCVHVSPNWSKVPDLDSSRRADHFALVFSSWGLLGLEIQAEIVSNCFLQCFGHFWPCYISKTPYSHSSHLADHFASVISSRGPLGLEIQAKIVSIFWGASLEYFWA